MKYKFYFKNQWIDGMEYQMFNIVSLDYSFFKWDGCRCVSFIVLGVGVDFEWSTKESRREARKLQKESEKIWEELKNAKKKTKR